MRGLIHDLKGAFADVFGVANPRRFQASGRHYGFSDDAQGVQWNAGIDVDRCVCTVGVNLEGKKYDGWPIGRFVAAERHDGRFVSFCQSYAHAASAELWFSRDAWQFSYRPPIKEQQLTESRFLLLHKLSTDEWMQVLGAATDCLGENGVGRRKVPVTLERTGEVVERWVSPHLQIKMVALTKDASGEVVADALRRVRASLEPVYSYVRARVERPHE